MTTESTYDHETPRVTLQVNTGCLVAPVQIDLYLATLDRFRDDVLAAIAANPQVSTLVVDLSGVAVLDAWGYDRVSDVLVMASVMGVRGVITGIRPGVAWALVDLDVDVRRVTTRARLEDGMAYLASLDAPLREDEDDGPGTDPDDNALHDDDMIAADPKVEDAPAADPLRTARGLSA